MRLIHFHPQKTFPRRHQIFIHFIPLALLPVKGTITRGYLSSFGRFIGKSECSHTQQTNH